MGTPDHADDDARTDDALVALLRQATPAPSTAWQHELERSLFPSRHARPRRRLLPVAAAAGSLAALTLIAGLVGSGPLAIDGGDDARARPGCEVVFVTKVRPVGQVVRQPDGTVTVETTNRPVTSERERCTSR